MKKIIAVILALMLAIPASVFAFAAPKETGTIKPVYRVNPLYEGLVSFEKPENKFENSINAYGVTYHTDIADVGAEVRENLKNRVETFTVGYRTADFDGSDDGFSKICEDILSHAFMHTGVSDEGDYIQWHWGRYGAGTSYSYNGEYYSMAITFYFEYYTTAAQEQAVTEKLEEVYEELDLEEKNDYYKICAIYDYICDNVVYDYDNLNNEAYPLQFTAYAALINGTSVCQGYANLFYRMALDWGVDARLIAGDAGGGHAWNIVKMGDYYYNLDSTWDAGLRPNYMWFLKCPATFVNHYRYLEYETPEFHAAYPMGATDYVYNESDFGGPGDDFGGSDVVASGYCGGEGDGTNLKWSLDKDGVLTISGEGKMADYSRYSGAPWKEYSNQIKKLVLKNGITEIGKYAFYECKATGSLTIPDGVIIIGEAAFKTCSFFTGDLIIPDSVTTIEKEAFAWCGGFDGNIKLGNDLTTIGESAFQQCSKLTGNLVLPEKLEIIGPSAFFVCENLSGDLIIPDSVIEIGAFAFSRCSGFEGKLVISSGIKSIEKRVFDGCYNLTGKLFIPENVESIGEGAFSDCAKITGNLIIPDNVESIGDWAFYRCKGINGTLEIGSSVKIIGERAFHSCENITGKLVIPENIERIEEGTFSGCKGFTGELVIPEKVNNIGSFAFAYCEGFTGDLIIPDSVTRIEESAFRECTGFSGDLVIGNGVVTVCANAFLDCSGFKEKLVLGEKIENININAFKNCSGFSGETIIHKNINSIESAAFENCGVNTYYFKGKAPEACSADKTGKYPSYESASFDGVFDTIYYPKGNDTWNVVAGKWNGYNAVEYRLNGDLNGDAEQTVEDVYMIRLVVAKLAELTDEQKNAADLDGDGKVTAIDANILRKYILGIITEIPVAAG